MLNEINFTSLPSKDRSFHTVRLVLLIFVSFTLPFIIITMLQVLANSKTFTNVSDNFVIPLSVIGIAIFVGRSIYGMFQVLADQRKFFRQFAEDNKWNYQLADEITDDNLLPPDYYASTESSISPLFLIEGKLKGEQFSFYPLRAYRTADIVQTNPGVVYVTVLRVSSQSYIDSEEAKKFRVIRGEYFTYIIAEYNLMKQSETHELFRAAHLT